MTQSIRNTIIIAALLASAMTAPAQTTGETMFLSGSHAMVRTNNAARYVLLPVEEKAEMCNIRVLADGEALKTLNVRMAVDHIDYYVPLDLSPYKDKHVLLDIHSNGNNRNEGALREFACWKAITYSDTFDTENREHYRPACHHTPSYGWMNDPNGMFYKDGEWHLFYQYNPYGSQWENMHWRHSVSRDLVTWQDRGVALSPDGLGTVFSGSCVVDHENTAGFGRGAIVAFYTSAGESQTQSMAYSTDGGQTFTKYAGNPVVTSNVPDFRDPHVFRHEETDRWIMILAAGQEMNIYSSANLRDWTYESSFGHGYGNHDGVWECPDLMELPVSGTGEKKWVLLCNINPGGPFGGSATQYFTGTFDGHRFTCESAPEVTKWMDYGKDHYATVTFDNAPDGRRVAIGWMSNWQYANQLPTMQYRSANTIARDLGLFTDGGETYLSSTPSPEMTTARGKVLARRSSSRHRTFAADGGAYEINVDFISSMRKPLTITLQNPKGETVVMTYDPAARTFSMDRTASGQTGFSDAFPVVTTAPVYGGLMRSLRIFVDCCSIEAFDGEGRMAMTNLVFPSEPYNTITVSGGKAATTVYAVGR
ncbi:MAG: DUF4980 domain-containing protein [Prevotella sp.]|nr:DUF4980 domain-containing protein [Prevotella sp.]